MDLACADRGRKKRTAECVFCNDRKPGRVPVETVETAEGKRNALLFVIHENRVCECVVIIVHRRMRRHAGGLVYDKDIFVLVEDCKRKIHGENAIGAGIFD